VSAITPEMRARLRAEIARLQARKAETMITVHPIQPAERVHCAYCAKPLQPNHGCRKTFYSGTIDAKGLTPEEQLAAYSTNRRVVRIARSYQQIYDDSTGSLKPSGRKVSRIEVVHFPDPDGWGLWGAFCGQLCAARFGYASHKAGYRIKTKANAA
jgi:hypothetical protein